MNVQQLLLLALPMAAVAASPATLAGTDDWRMLGRAAATDRVRFAVALEHEDFDGFAARVLEISDPAHPDYGQFMTNDEVLEWLAPDVTIARDVETLVRRTCASDAALQVENRRDAVHVEATAECAEELLGVTLGTWAHSELPLTATRLHEESASPSLVGAPVELQERVALISGLGMMPHVRRGASHRNTAALGDSGNSGDYGFIAADTISRIYGLPKDATIKAKNNTIAAIEFTGVSAPPLSDVKDYCAANNRAYVDYTKKIGPYEEGGSDGESLLDVSLIQGVATKASIYYVTIADGWIYEMASQLFALGDEAPLVSSISYGWMESMTCDDVTHAKCADEGDPERYVVRTNKELAKLAGVGQSIITCSQDEGAPSDQNAQCTNTEQPVWAIYPASSPWVTTVSSTTLLEAPRPNAANSPKPDAAAAPSICSDQTKPCATGSHEVITMANNTAYSWTTGGGFGNYSTRPSYQDHAVANYLVNAPNLPPNWVFQRGNRGYPDISAVGARILLKQSGSITNSAGTSASTPIFASIVTLLNDERLLNDKKPLGFLNPLLYHMLEEHPAAFYQISEGTNAFGTLAAHPCQYGYEGYAGNTWNPSTGLGTVNYPEMSRFISTLP